MKKAALLYLFLVFKILVFSQQVKEQALIPFPSSLVLKEGSFRLSHNTQLVVSDKEKFFNEVTYLQTLLSQTLGQSLSSQKGENVLEIAWSDQIKNEEGYCLNITPQRITMLAQTPAGLFYAIQTLHQMILLNNKATGQITLPALSINDEPAFEWRGSMIDVARHLFTIDYLKRHIDRLSFYKMNKLHLHLTDDHGWRIEIKKYPKLTSVSGFRTFNSQDSYCMEMSKTNPDFEIDRRFITEKDGKPIYGGYYTQDELRDLVAYAARRHVEIIPEIDMPGHMMAAISAYPELIDRKSGQDGSYFGPLCPCKDLVYSFIEDVIAEVASIFPSPYIHVGSDEVDPGPWKESELCKQLMAKENIADVNKLQSYFAGRVQKIIESKGKKMICWDEVLDGEVDSSVNIMYWRGGAPDSPMRATSNGNPVIMSPTNPLYFDAFPDKSSLHSVYNMSVVYDNVPKDKRHLIKGAQANMWTELIPSERRADFMLFPRITALAERVWTNKDLFDSYRKRLLAHYSILDKMGIAYRLPDVGGFAMESVYVGKGVFDIKSPLADKAIHYTTDGSLPNQQSQILRGPLMINKPSSIRFALFSDNSTAKGDVYTVNYKESTYSPAIQTSQTVSSGLTCDFYNQSVYKTSEISGNPEKQVIVRNITVPTEALAPKFGLKYNGYIHVPEKGIYSFYLTCDDGGMLYIADRLVIENEGPHSPIEKSGQVALEKGLHPFHLDFVEAGSGYTLLLQYSLNGGEVKDVPDNWFVH